MVVYSVGYQWQFAQSTLLEMAYVGNRGVRFAAVPRDESADLRARPNDGRIEDLFRPYPGFSSVLRSTNWGKSEYNGLETTVQRRFTNGLGFQAAYTLSSSKDYSSHFHSGATNRQYVMTPQDDDNIPAEWAYSDFDARHRFVIAEVYDLPIRPRPALADEPNRRQHLRQLDAGEHLDVAKRLPVQRVRRQRSLSDRGQLHTDLSSESRRRPGSKRRRAHAGAVVQHGRVSARRCRPVRRHTAQRDPRTRHDQRRHVDHQAATTQGVKQGMNLEIRIEAFNLFNRVNFGAPTNDMSSSAFGRIGATATDAREFQFGCEGEFLTSQGLSSPWYVDSSIDCADPRVGRGRQPSRLKPNGPTATRRWRGTTTMCTSKGDELPTLGADPPIPPRRRTDDRSRLPRAAGYGCSISSAAKHAGSLEDPASIRDPRGRPTGGASHSFATTEPTPASFNSTCRAEPSASSLTRRPSISIPCTRATGRRCCIRRAPRATSMYGASSCPAAERHD